MDFKSGVGGTLTGDYNSLNGVLRKNLLSNIRNTHGNFDLKDGVELTLGRENFTIEVTLLSSLPFFERPLTRLLFGVSTKGVYNLFRNR